MKRQLCGSLLLLLGAACFRAPSRTLGDGGTDGSVSALDAGGATDAGGHDAGRVDAGLFVDAGLDGGAEEDSGVDGGAADAGPNDAGVSDAGCAGCLVDAGVQDGGADGGRDAGVDAGCNGLDFFATYYMSGVSPTSVAAGDLRGAGIQDVVALNETSATLAVFFNDGQGNLSMPAIYPTGSTPVGIAIGDLNRDGLQDIVIANY